MKIGVYTEGSNFWAKVIENDVKKSVAVQNDNAFRRDSKFNLPAFIR